MQVRAGGAAGGADRSDHLALFNPVADLYVDAREVQEVGADPEAVVEQQRAAGQVQVRAGEGDDLRAGAFTGVPVGTAMSMPE